MTIFAILMPTPQPGLVEAIKRLYPEKHISITETQWLISSSGTAVELSAKLGIVDPARALPTGNAIVFATSSYFGRAPTAIWDWIKVQLEAPPSG
jgi:hypothetical protein